MLAVAKPVYGVMYTMCTQLGVGLDGGAWHCLAMGMLTMGAMRGMYSNNNHGEGVSGCVTMVKCVDITYETQTCSWGKYGEMKEIHV